MQALANEFSESKNRSQQINNQHARGLQFFRATAPGSSAVTEVFHVQIQIGNPDKDEDQFERLQVATYLTITNVKVLIFKEFNIPFEEQTLFHKTVLLEDPLELGALGIHEGSIIYIVRQKRYRSIGASQTTIKTIVLNAAATDGYDFVDLPAPLPPFHIIVKRIVFAVMYLRRLDRMQQPTSRNKIWVTNYPTSNDADFRQSRSRRIGPKSKHKEIDFGLPALRASLTVPYELRTQADIRIIKKWLGTIKYFIDANVPDSSLLDVSRHITFASYSPGDFVFRQGDSGDVFYIIIHGSLSIAGHGAGLFTTLHTGQCFGEVGLFKNCSGLRSASAIVNFDTSTTDVACISRDIYIRSIGMYKQDMLLEYEKMLSECPQFATLTKESLTLLAYAAECLHLDAGDILLHTGTRVEYLYLLVRGEFKITASTVVRVTRPVVEDEDDDDAALDENPTFEKRASVMTLRHAPSIFGHEACMSLKMPQSQYDVKAVGPCMLLSFSNSSLRRFVMNHEAVMREIYRDYQIRNSDIERRLSKVVAHVMTQDPKLDTEIAALDTFFEHTLSRNDDAKATASSMHTPRRQSTKSNPQPPVAAAISTPSIQSPRPPKQPAGNFTTAFAEMCRNHFHATLPHGDLLTYEEQVHYSSKPSTSLSSEEQLTKMRCLIDGLRRLQPVDVQFIEIVPHADGDQFTFM